MKEFSSQRILFVGVGGLGCSSLSQALQLGARTIRLVDGDVVEESNLCRQILYSENHLGRLKVEVASHAAEAAGAIVQIHPTFLDRNNLFLLAHNVDLIIDGTDNQATRELLNRALTTLNKPVIFAGVGKSSGYALVCQPGRACYRCVWKEEPADTSCDSQSISAEFVQRIGRFQTEVAHTYLRNGSAKGEANLFTFNSNSDQVRELFVDRYPACPICGA